MIMKEVKGEKHWYLSRPRELHIGDLVRVVRIEDNVSEKILETQQQRFRVVRQQKSTDGERR